MSRRLYQTLARRSIKQAADVHSVMAWEFGVMTGEEKLAKDWEDHKELYLYLPMLVPAHARRIMQVCSENGLAPAILGRHFPDARITVIEEQTRNYQLAMHVCVCFSAANCEYSWSQIDAFQPPSGSADCIILDDFFSRHPAELRGKLFERFMEALSPGGRLIVCGMPDSEFGRSELQDLLGEPTWHRQGPPTHLCASIDK